MQPKVYEVVPNHHQWDVLEGDALMAVHDREACAVRHALREAVAHAPSHLTITDHQGRVVGDVWCGDGRAPGTGPDYDSRSMKPYGM
ncbi:hypothetical protein [Catellatospora sp. NPDC049609]|uniref:hypothetical protein n=1 Tax=Catellatospora sp. NPDC049609 TaxID=3155505 RepID=UPI00342F808F